MPKSVCVVIMGGGRMEVCLLQFYFINILVSGAELGESHWNCEQHWLWCLWQCHGAFALFIPGCTTRTAFREYFQTESLISTYVESSQSSWELSSLLFNSSYLPNVCQRWKFKMIVWRNLHIKCIRWKEWCFISGHQGRLKMSSGQGDHSVLSCAITYLSKLSALMAKILSAPCPDLLCTDVWQCLTTAHFNPTCFCQLVLCSQSVYEVLWAFWLLWVKGMCWTLILTITIYLRIFSPLVQPYNIQWKKKTH